MGEAKLAPAEQIGGDDVERDSANPRAGSNSRWSATSLRSPWSEIRWSRAPKKPEEARQRIERKDVPAADSAPDVGKLLRRCRGRRAGGDERPVERADRGPNDQVRGHLALVERAEHAGLNGPKAGAAGEDEGCVWRIAHVSVGVRLSPLLTPGAWHRKWVKSPWPGSSSGPIIGVWQSMDQRVFFF